MSEQQDRCVLAAPTAVGRRPWQPPTLRRLQAGSAEAGANPAFTEGAFARGDPPES